MLPIPNSLKSIAAALKDDLYVVGGYVRNYLLFGSTRSTDIDVCGKLKPDEISEALSGTASVIPVSPRIGTVRLRKDKEEYEYTAFRRDSYPIGGIHRPETVEFVSTAEEDALRRDFTVNAIYYDIKNERFLDVLGGIEDIKAKKIRTANTWEKTFDEDGLRLMRAVRFASQLGFDLSDDCYLGIKVKAPLLKDISSERKKAELDLILTADVKYSVENAHLKGITLLKELGLLPYLLPRSSYSFPERFSIIEAANAGSRLDAFVYETYHSLTCPYQKRQFISDLLGNSGLRYPIKTISEQIYLSEFWDIDDLDALKLKLKREYASRIATFGVLIKNDVAASAEKILERLNKNDVPMAIKELDVDGKTLISLDVPKKKRTIALDAVLKTCLKEERRLSINEQIEILKGFTEND